MIGTVINVVAILVGGTLGTSIGDRMPPKLQETVMHGLGLMCVVLGLSMALQSQNLLIVMGSVLLGGIVGEWWGIEARLENLGRWLEDHFGRPEDAARGRSIMRAFVTTSLLYCVGPLAIVGSVLDGLTGNFQPLVIKSTLDGFASLAFGASLGPGVLFSTVPIVVYQGSLSLLARLFGASLTGITADTPAVVELSATGGVLIMAIGLMLLEIKQIRVGNFLPAVFMAPLVVTILTQLGAVF